MITRFPTQVNTQLNKKPHTYGEVEVGRFCWLTEPTDIIIPFLQGCKSVLIMRNLTMEYVALFGCLGTAHASKNKKLSRVVWDEIIALVDSPQDVEKPFQVSPTTVILSRKRGG